MTEKTVTQATVDERKRRHGVTALMLGGLVFGMLGLSYAAVPLYQLFCQITGYGGTTQRAESAPTEILEKKVAVRFDANTAQGIGWEFTPKSRPMAIRIGKQGLAFYQAHNPTSETIRGTATFNVSPAGAGSYFNKIQCFCFTEQVLAPGETVDMPVTFFVDPEIVNDPDARNIREITLSYTFFPVKEEAKSDADEAKKDRAS